MLTAHTAPKTRFEYAPVEPGCQAAAPPPLQNRQPVRHLLVLARHEGPGAAVLVRQDILHLPRSKFIAWAAVVSSDVSARRSGCQSETRLGIKHEARNQVGLEYLCVESPGPGQNRLTAPMSGQYRQVSSSLRLANSPDPNAGPDMLTLPKSPPPTHLKILGHDLEVQLPLAAVALDRVADLAAKAAQVLAVEVIEINIVAQLHRLRPDVRPCVNGLMRMSPMPVRTRADMK